MGYENAYDAGNELQKWMALSTVQKAKEHADPLSQYWYTKSVFKKMTNQQIIQKLSPAQKWFLQISQTSPAPKPEDRFTLPHGIKPHPSRTPFKPQELRYTLPGASSGTTANPLPLAVQ